MSKKLLIETQLFEGRLQEDAEGRVIVKGILQRAGAENHNGRIYPKHILEREVEKYQTLIKERRALGECDHPECLRPSAEILTSDGWKLISDVVLGETVMTLNMESGNVEMQPVSRVINDPYKGHMISFKGRGIDTMVTPNHRVVLSDRNGNLIEKTAAELLEISKTTQNPHLSIPKTASGWVGDDYDTYTISPITGVSCTSKNYKLQGTPLVVDADAWFYFLGVYLSEGHVTNRTTTKGFGVFLTQNEGVKCDKIREVLSKLSPDLKWREIISGSKVKFATSDARLHTYLSALGDVYSKHIPSDIKNASPRLLSRLFDGYVLGDGTVVEYNGYIRTSIFSVSKKLMEDFNEILLKIGMTGTIKIQTSSKPYVFADHVIHPDNKKPLYRLWVEQTKSIHVDFRFMQIEEVPYDGTVHCVTVPNGTFYCRDQGKSFWTGNSNLINLKNVSHNIRELKWDGDDLVGVVEILSTPSGNILKELLRSKILLGISSRGMGSVKEHKGQSIVQEDFELLCWDFVSNPSTQGAFMTPLTEGKTGNVSNTSSKYKDSQTLMMNILSELS